MVIGFLRGRYKFDLRNFAPSKIFFKKWPDEPRDLKHNFALTDWQPVQLP